MGDENASRTWSMFVSLGADVEHRTLIPGRPAPVFTFDPHPASTPSASNSLPGPSSSTMTIPVSIQPEPRTGSSHDMTIDDDTTHTVLPANVPLPPSPTPHILVPATPVPSGNGLIEELSSSSQPLAIESMEE
jgi:hypothetical protein